jgi:hypothetical protein
LTNYIFASALTFPLVVKKSSPHLAALSRYIGRFLALGSFAAAATIFGSLGYIHSVAAYIEAVKQVEIPMTLAAGIVFFSERERVQAVWPGSAILMLGVLILIFVP